MSRLAIPAHSFLFALFPILNLYVQNIGEIPITDILQPSLLILAITAVLIVVLGLLLRDRRKAALIVSLLWVFSFGYMAAFQALREILGGASLSRYATNQILLPLTTAGFAAIGFAILRTRRPLGVLSRSMDTASVLLVLFSVGRIVLFALAHPSDVLPDRRAGDDSGIAAAAPITLAAPQTPPDIYYFVFDRYPSGDVLRRFYGFDNSGFLDHLRELGFRVFDGANANYPMTHLSLASSLNLDYLGPLYLGRLHYRRPIARNRLVQALRSAGYRYIHVGSWYEPTRKSPLADRNVNHPWSFSEFTTALIRTTPYHLVFLKDQRVKESLYAFDELERIPSEKGPKLVFLHLLLPHPPYLFNADGSLASPAQTSSRSDGENFIEQLRFVNQRVERLLDVILSESHEPPVIILQADEGPLLDAGEGGMSRTDMWRKRCGILNAYLLPGEGPEPYPGITPVNTFRLVFRRYFQSPIELLEDRTYYWADTKPDGSARDLYGRFPFIDVTDELKALESAGPPDHASGRPFSGDSARKETPVTP